MNNYEKYLEKKKEINKKLSSVILKPNEETRLCWEVANNLMVSGTTVKNYLDGRVSDGYLGEAIYFEFKRLKCVK